MGEVIWVQFQDNHMAEMEITDDSENQDQDRSRNGNFFPIDDLFIDDLGFGQHGRSIEPAV